MNSMGLVSSMACSILLKCLAIHVLQSHAWQFFSSSLVIRQNIKLSYYFLILSCIFSIVLSIELFFLSSLSPLSLSTSFSSFSSLSSLFLFSCISLMCVSMLVMMSFLEFHSWYSLGFLLRRQLMKYSSYLTIRSYYDMPLLLVLVLLLSMRLSMWFLVQLRSIMAQQLFRLMHSMYAVRDSIRVYYYYVYNLYYLYYVYYVCYSYCCPTSVTCSYLSYLSCCPLMYRQQSSLR